MADFQVVQTNLGAALLAKCLTGTKLEFTKIVMGDSVYSGNLAAVKAVIAPKIELSISKITRKENIAVLRAVLTFKDITEGFTWREIGLYAVDPDTGEPVLYAYGNAKDAGDYIPDGSKTTLTEKRINITAVTSNAPNVTAVIDESLVFASKEDVKSKADVSVLEKHVGDEDVHITVEERALWNGKADAVDLNAHSSSMENPHHVTAAQVGLGNVNNTTDADKSVKYAATAGSAPANGGTAAWAHYSSQQVALTAPGLRNITISSTTPSGGNDGDIWHTY